MSIELFVASRYLFSRRRQTFTTIITIISVLGVAIGVGSMVVVMGVYNGFTHDLRDKILGVNPHIMIQPTTPAGVRSFDAVFDLEGTAYGGYVGYADSVSKLDGVASVSPYLYTEVLVSTPKGSTGLVVRGLEVNPIDDSKTINSSSTPSAGLPILDKMQEGSLHDIAYRESGMQGIIIGEELAFRFSLDIGNQISLMSPTGRRTAVGFMPKIVNFEIVGIFNAGLSDFDSRLAFIPLQAAQELINMPFGRVSGLEVYLDDPYQANEIGEKIIADIGLDFIARNWMDLNAGLFAALELERIGMFLVLAMIILVASFSIITSLVMLVMEKTKDIAILMSMGATAKNIRRIFMLQGTIIGILGTSIGYIIGLTLAFLLKKYQFIELPPGVFIMDHLPVLISAPDTILIGFVSILMCFLATIYPAWQAAKLVPTQALRYE